jgi:hypothetical protein
MARRMRYAGIGESPASEREGAKTPTGGAEPGAARDTMQETWYDLAVRELSDLTDHAKEMRDEAERAETTETAAPTPMADEDEAPPVPPAAAA